MTTHVTVALDNITLRGIDVDPAALLTFGEIQNDWLERNRAVIAEHSMRVMCFGSSAYIINHATGDMELVDL